MQLEQKIAKQLICQGKTLAVAESCTGGFLTHRLTNVPGSSAFLVASIVSYANQAKIDSLNIPASVIKKNGAVSPPVARLMSRNIQKLFNTDLGVGITGIAGPAGGSVQKPVGTVFIAACDRKRIISEHHVFKGTRLEIKKQAVNRALGLLFKLLIT